MTALLSASLGVILAALAASMSPGLVLHSASLLASPAPFPAPSPAPSSRTGPVSGLSKVNLEGQQIQFYMKKPEGEGTWPGVVLAHDSMGLDADSRKLVDRLAAEGFVVMAPDLHGGKIALDEDKGREMSVLLDESGAVATLEAVVKHLKFLSEVGDHRVGLIGFDMGGRLALLGGMASQDVSGVVVGYGRPVTDEDSLRRIACPLLGLFGDQDATIPLKDVEAFRSALAAAGRTADVRIYEGAGHGFMKESGSRFKPDAAADAWSLMVAFLRDHL